MAAYNSGQGICCMNKTDKYRAELAKLITDNMGKVAGKLFSDFYKDDEVESMTDGARALLDTMIGPTLTHKKIKEARKVLL